MSSADLTHWVQHPMAITPAAPTSYEGADVYSGAMIEDPSDGSVKAFLRADVVMPSLRGVTTTRSVTLHLLTTTLQPGKSTTAHTVLWYYTFHKRLAQTAQRTCQKQVRNLSSGTQATAAGS